MARTAVGQPVIRAGGVGPRSRAITLIKILATLLILKADCPKTDQNKD
jgi:hypothetical protein